MSAVVPIVVILVILIIGGVGIFFTWPWWKRLLNRCLTRGNPPAVPDAQWDDGGRRNSPTFQQLDPSTLERGRRLRNSVTIEPLPTLSELHIDPRHSFELRRTKFPQGVVPLADANNIFAHDWFHHPHESFPRSNLEYLKVLGKGWFGKVIEAEAKNITPMAKTKTVIVKKMRDDANDEEQMRFLNQCRIHRDSTHPNILKLLGFAVDELPYLAIFEYWPLGDLKTFLIAKEKVGESAALLNQGTIVRMAIGIAKGLEGMFEEGFVHEDLAARNCLIANAAGKVVIGDYGLATKAYPKDYYRTSNQVIPIRWSAPESFDFQNGTATPMQTTANIWSFGVVLWELYQFGKTPYGDMNDEEVISRVLVSKTYMMGPPDFPYLQDSAKDRLYKLMLSCWNSVPENRPSIQEIGEILSTP